MAAVTVTRSDVLYPGTTSSAAAAKCRPVPCRTKSLWREESEEGVGRSIQCHQEPQERLARPKRVSLFISCACRPKLVSPWRDYA